MDPQSVGFFCQDVLPRNRLCEELQKSPFRHSPVGRGTGKPRSALKLVGKTTSRAFHSSDPSGAGPAVSLFLARRLCAEPGTQVSDVTSPRFVQPDGSADKPAVDFCKSFDTFVLQLIFDGTTALSREKDALRLKKPHPSFSVVLSLCHFFIRCNHSTRNASRSPRNKKRIVGRVVVSDRFGS